MCRALFPSPFPRHYEKWNNTGDPERGPSLAVNFDSGGVVDLELGSPQILLSRCRWRGGRTPHVPSADRGSSVRGAPRGSTEAAIERVVWWCPRLLALKRGHVLEEGSWMGSGGGEEVAIHLLPCVFVSGGHLVSWEKRGGPGSIHLACPLVWGFANTRSETQTPGPCALTNSKYFVDQPPPPKRDPCSLGPLPRSRSLKA